MRNDTASTDEERQHLEALLTIHHKNLRRLEQQTAQYGALNVPLHIQNSLDDEQEQIARIEAQIRDLDAPPPALPDALDNLPILPNLLVGRDHELTAVLGLLRHSDVRMVTLTGPGGTGKTRLGLAIAIALRAELAHGVWLAKLAPISDSNQVLPAIAQVLGVTEHGNQTLLTRLKEHLRERQLLLVLDNCEQVLQAANQIAELLSAAPQLKILATSRAALRIAAEHEFGVPPLELPELQAIPTGAELATAIIEQSAAVTLFVQRARAARPGFALTREHARAVAEICVRLDGLPLAIELAAARSKILAPKEMLARLSNPLKLLTGGARDLLPHQQTLRGTIDWSYNLLDADGQALFARLAVFVGGCTLETAEAVCGGFDRQAAIGGAPITYSVAPLAQDVLDGLAALVDQSLLQQIDQFDSDARFTMLETIREYALERVVASGEADALRLHHAEHFLALAEQAEPELIGAQQEIWLTRLDAEHDNLRGALAWALEQHIAELASRLSAALWRFWYMRGYLSEGRKWLEQALALGDSVALPTRAKVLGGAGGLAYAQWDYVQASAHYEESLALRRAIRDRQGIGRLLNNLGVVARDQGDYATARIRLEEALAIWREMGDAWNDTAATLNNLGVTARVQDDHAGARMLYEESLALYRTLGDVSSIASTLNNLGEIALDQEDDPQAQIYFEESLTLFRKLKDQRLIAYTLMNVGLAAYKHGDYDLATSRYVESLTLLQELRDQGTIAECLEGLAGVAAAQGRTERAARLCGAAEALRELIGAPLSPADRSRYEHMVADAQARLGAATWMSSWTVGRTMAVEEALAEAVGGR